MYKLKISSSLKPYDLEFTNNYNKDLKKLYSKGDLILIDSIIFLTYGLPQFINKTAIIIIKTDWKLSNERNHNIFAKYEHLLIK